VYVNVSRNQIKVEGNINMFMLQLFDCRVGAPVFLKSAYLVSGKTEKVFSSKITHALKYR
jgi:hypothetical protein